MSEVLVDVKNLKKYFPTGEKGKTVKAVDDISFQIYKGETLGVVGESGCGKSTTGRLVLHLLEPTEGTVTFDGQDLSRLKKSEMRTMRKRMQIIFQDPYASLDPRKTVFQILEEPYRIHHPEMSREEIYTQVERLIACVGLRPEHITRYPHEFSGGQRQRVGIARAIALNPEFVVCDEPVSALDVSIQAQVINLMQDIKKEFSLTYMFISHDLRIIKHFCDRVMVMYLERRMQSMKSVVIPIPRRSFLPSRTFVNRKMSIEFCLPVIFRVRSIHRPGVRSIRDAVTVWISVKKKSRS